MNFTSWNLPGASAFTELRHFYDDTNPFEPKPIPGVYYLTTKLQRIYPLEEEEEEEEKEEEGKDLCVRETYASACMQTSFPSLKALPGFARALKADPYTLRVSFYRGL